MNEEEECDGGEETISHTHSLSLMNFVSTCVSVSVCLSFCPLVPHPHLLTLPYDLCLHVYLCLVISVFLSFCPSVPHPHILTLPYDLCLHVSLCQCVCLPVPRSPTQYPYIHPYTLTLPYKLCLHLNLCLYICLPFCPLPTQALHHLLFTSE